MHTTSVSFLNRLKRAGPDASEWRKLQEIYSPLVRSWLSGVPGLRQEADDLAQDVLRVLSEELPAFERQRDGSFRAWLRQIVRNRIKSWYKARRKQPSSSKSRSLPTGTSRP